MDQSSIDLDEVDRTCLPGLSCRRQPAAPCCRRRLQLAFLYASPSALVGLPPAVGSPAAAVLVLGAGGVLLLGAGAPVLEGLGGLLVEDGLLHGGAHLGDERVQRERHVAAQHLDNHPACIYVIPLHLICIHASQIRFS